MDLEMVDPMLRRRVGHLLEARRDIMTFQGYGKDDLCVWIPQVLGPAPTDKRTLAYA